MSQLSGPEQGELHRVIKPNVTEDQVRRAVRFGGLGDYGDARGDDYPARLEWAIEHFSHTYQVLAFTVAVQAEAKTPPLQQWIDSHRNSLRVREAALSGQTQASKAHLTEPEGRADAEVYGAVARFDEQCKQRRKLFGYLSANKKLHEILHRLPSCAYVLRLAAAALKSGGQKPRLLLFRELDELVQEANAELQKIELASDQEDWVKALETTARGLRAWFNNPQTSPDPPLEELIALTSQNQKGLNDELARIAKRLEADELSDSAKKVLEALENSQETLPVDPARIEKFYGICVRVVGLVDQHGACQFADTALLVTVGRADVATTNILKWGKLKAGLEKLAARRPQDDLAQNVFQRASEFEGAGDTDRQARFESFQEQFNSLFANIDKELLDATTDLISQVTELGATLEGYLRGRRGN